ncbi:MAG: methanogenesis marker 2 protein [Methanoregulaceae archaeon]|nr:methanogenesis marker 2 protein [Methanoregulaceae archaeon]
MRQNTIERQNFGGIVVSSCSTEEIARAVRDYEGVRRKHAIGEMVKVLRTDAPGVIASFGEDAAVIEHRDEVLLLAADGIWSRLMEADPYWAGYCSVLVNIHDIAAMGGKPIAMVDVFSIASDTIRDDVIRGMHDASAQFGVPIVGGHLHPDTPYSVIDVAILGTAKKDAVIYSHTAREGDTVVVAVDLNGRVHPSCIMNWDSVTDKSPAYVRNQIALMEELGKGHLVTAGKDISNPGVIGTLGMLLEVSGRGASIDLDAIPRPDLAANAITLEQWVRVYPGMGFVLTIRPEHLDEVCRRFAGVGMTSQAIGTVDNSRMLKLVSDGQCSSVFDFTHNGIMHLDLGSGACR